jgi:hypothetical protein
MPAVASASPEASDGGSTRIGRSVHGRVIEVGCIGGGEHTLLVVDGLHTGTEAIGSDLAVQIAQAAWSGGLDVPADARLCVLPALNPDGLELGSPFEREWC